MISPWIIFLPAAAFALLSATVLVRERSLIWLVPTALNGAVAWASLEKML